MIDQVRTFIAVDLSLDCVDYISTLQSQIKGIIPDLKWVNPDNCHITLKFLGSISADSIEHITKALQPSLESTNSFSVKTSNVSTFPSLQSPKILWLGLSDPQNKLQLLFNTVEETLYSFPKENRPFIAHITLARGHIPTSMFFINAIQTKSVEINIRHVTFYQSILSLQEPKYVPLHRWLLK
ncbi:MAG: RNA 2',3'-cyclic phosphodiesterase [Candidatus Omnitrophica bacterium]|nr:RNA 2',3'-cyclic phosphodiesterase [Candidatus Omnitrophota bacterium]